MKNKKNEAISLAQELYKPYLKNLEDYKPIRVVYDLIIKNTIDIVYWNFTLEKFSGMLVYFDDYDNYTIALSQNHPMKRKTFTIAHELGHYLMHKDIKKEFYCNDIFRANNTAIEIEANNFAAELLMPEKSFEYYIRKKWSISKIADSLSISYEAAKWRFVCFCEKHSDDFKYDRKENIKKALFEDKYDINTKYKC